MTSRAVTVAVGSAILMAVGWQTNWSELTALGAAGLALVGLVVAWAGTRPAAAVTLERHAVRVAHGTPADARLAVTAGPRWRWLRVVEGEVGAPYRTLRMPKPATAGASTLRVPIDTSTRGRWQVGPYSVVNGDPWSLVRRVVAASETGVVTVLPRVHPIRRAVLAGLSVDDSALSSTRHGEQHFHALRDYTLGDEPRSIHWRSTARAGHLVVRQQVAAATTGTAVVLDCDRSAYGSDEKFGSGWVADRFENAVEAAASFCVADVSSAEQVHLVTTTAGAAVVSAPAGSSASLLDALAVVSATQPVDSQPADLPGIVRRTRSARVVVVTGTPAPGTVQAVHRLRRTGVSVLLIRIGSRQPAISNLRVLDITSAAELV